MLLKSIRKFFPAILLIFSISAMAQTSQPAQVPDQDNMLMLVLVFVLVVSILVLAIAVYLLFVVRKILDQREVKTGGLTMAAKEEDESGAWSRLVSTLTKAAPIEEEKTILLDHAYDGIHELDNHLPPWWKGLFYFTIAFGVVYLVVYHMIQPSWAPMQDEAYALEVDRFEAMRAQMTNFIDETNVSIATEPALLENGKQIFTKNCSPCHRMDGGGSFGPNLTDNYWIHGNRIEDVFITVKNGVPGKMVAWGASLSGADIRDVASYVLTELVGSNPEAALPPQGELVEDSKAKVEMNSDTVETETARPIAAVGH